MDVVVQVGGRGGAGGGTWWCRWVGAGGLEQVGGRGEGGGRGGAGGAGGGCCEVVPMPTDTTKSMGELKNSIQGGASSGRFHRLISGTKSPPKSPNPP